MAAIAYPLRNGTRYDHSSLDIMMAGTNSYSLGISSIDYSDNLDPGVARGTPAQPVGFTTGKYEAQGSFSILRAEYDLFAAYLYGVYGGSQTGLYQITFDIEINYISDVPGQGVVTDSVVGCRIKKPSKSSAQGGSPHEVKIDLNVTYIIGNNIPPLTNMRF